jgi:hypothetical protein
VNHVRTIAQHVIAGAIVVAVLGAAAAGLSVELVRRGVVRLLVPWGRA